MNEIMISMLQYIFSYLSVLGLGFLVINFLSNGFVGTFIRVKSSRGKFALVRVNGITGEYYRAGTLDGERLRYKNRDKKFKTIIVGVDDAKRIIGVVGFEVDDVNNSMIQKDFSVVEGNDAEKVDNLIVRALTKPTLISMNEKIILFMLVVIIIGLCGALYLGYMNSEALRGLNQIGNVL